jgi:hypothetical protein
MNTSRAHGGERVEPVPIGARGDDLPVILRRGVEVVVVVVEAAGLQARGLRGREHAERGASFEPKCLHRLNHLAHRAEVALLRLAPGRAHAEARRTCSLGRARLGDHRIEAHQLLGLDAGVVLRALRTIGAVFRAAAGLDRKQRRNLHFAWIEMHAVHARRLEHQFGKRQRKQRAHLPTRPVVAHVAEICRGRQRLSKRHDFTINALATRTRAQEPPRTLCYPPPCGEGGERSEPGGGGAEKPQMPPPVKTPTPTPLAFASLRRATLPTRGRVEAERAQILRATPRRCGQRQAAPPWRRRT